LYLGEIGNPQGGLRIRFIAASPDIPLNETLVEEFPLFSVPFTECVH
jgi:hypothetical protein